METLFNKYAEAWNAYNPEAIANLYRLPCAISDADGVETYTDKSSLIKKFALWIHILLMQLNSVLMRTSLHSSP